MHSTRTTLPWAIATTLGAAACTGGGGETSQPPVDSGTYAVADFDYVDPRPASFQPLGASGSPVFTATQRDELLGVAVVTGQGDTDLLDDAIGAQGQMPTNLLSMFPAGFAPLCGAAGDLDGIGGDELTIVGAVPGASSPFDYRALVFSQSTLGTFTLRTSFLFPWTGGASYASANHGMIEATDVDRDGRCELVVALQADENDVFGHDGVGWAGVLAFDPLAGTLAETFSAQLGTNAFDSQTQTLRLIAGQFDGDVDLELLLTRYVAVPFSQTEAIWYDDASHGHAWLGGQSFTSGLGLAICTRINWDSDAQDELAIVVGTSQGLASNVYETDDSTLALTLVQHLDWTASTINGDAVVRHVVAADFDGDHVEELLVEFGGPALSRDWAEQRELVYGVSVHSGNFWPGNWDHMASVDNSAGLFDLLPLVQAPLPSGLSATDVDGDGTDEAWLSRFDLGDLGTVPGNGGLAQRVEMVPVPFKHLEVVPGSEVRTGGFSGSLLPAGVFVPGDYDGENLVLRYTGVKLTALGDPVPLALLAAPPTKSGISQNYDASETAYGETHTTEVTTATIAGMCVSFDLGFEAGLIKDVFNVYAKFKFEHEAATTTANTIATTTATVYTGGHDEHVVVFHGQLYQSYQYQVVSAFEPSLVGTLVTIDEPVAARTYKWTLPYYESIARDNAHLATLLPQQIGDPASYMTRGDAVSRLTTNLGWIHPGSGPGTPVGQGSASTTLSIAVDDTNSTSEERKFKISGEAGWKLGPNVGSIAAGGTFGEIFEVAITNGTEFSGTVGDIQQLDDYADWSYGFGLLVYKHGQAPDGTELPGVMPCAVIDYWTDAFGPGYP